MKKYLSIFLSIVMIFTVIGTMQIANAEAEPISILAVKDQIRTVGRTEEVSDGIACDWTASGIEFTAVCGENASIALTLNSTAECYFTVFVDKVRMDYRVRTLNGDYTPVFASSENGLTTGTHTIKIIKQSERINVTTTLKSITLNNVSLGEKPAEPEYVFEMIGDSITSGNGSLDTNNQASIYSDGTRTYAYLTAQNFDAEARIVSQSGGTISALYGLYTKKSRKDEAFDYSSYQKPNIVTIALGTNDGTKTVDYWQENLKNFADAIRGGYNDNSIPIVFIHNLISNNDNLRANVAAAIKNLKAEDEAKYGNMYVTSGNNPQGGHPGQASHYKTSKKITRDLVELGLMPLNALRDDATCILNESTQKETTLNSFDSNITAVSGITSELVSPLDPADEGAEGKYAVKFTSDGTQVPVTNKNTLQATFGSVSNTNYRTKGVSFYLKYHDVDYDSNDETSVYDIPRLYFVNGSGDSSYDLYSVKLSDIKDNELTKVEIYWNEMPYSNYIFLRSFINCNSVKLCLDLQGKCEYTIDNMQAILCDYTYADNANQAYTYTTGYNSYKVIGILDGYEAETTVTTASTSKATSSTTTTSTSATMPSSVTPTPGSEYTTVLDFDTTLTEPVFGWQGGTSQSSVVDYATIDESYTDGNVAQLKSSTSYNNVGFMLGDVFSGRKVKSISFEIWAASAFNLDNRSGLRNGTSYADPSISMRALGYTDSKKFGVTTTKKNLVFDFSTISTTENINSWNEPHVSFNIGTSATLYVDNITITYEKYYADLDVNGTVERLYATEDGYITLPDAEIPNGEFAGWLTDGSDDLVPANTTLKLTEDKSFFAVATIREDQEAPNAPVFESKTSKSITLVANPAYQYSMDGVTWQNSNVFEGLNAGTEYTFYQRLKATPTKYASPASESITVKTSAEYKWDIYSTYFTKNSGSTLAGGFDTTYKNDGTYFVSSNNAVGATATLTSLLPVESGVYAVKLYARAAGNRARIDVSINGTKVATNLNTGKNGSIDGLDYGFALDNVTITEDAQPITLTFTTTTSGNLYLNSLELVKIADVEKDGETTEGLTTRSDASIRLGEVSGIRFYTVFDESKIDGEVVEKGTIIGPKDKIGNYLTMDDVDTTGNTVKNAIVVRYPSNKLWPNNEFVGSIIGIRTSNFNREFVARAYVKLADGTYLYSTDTTVKTVADIADAFIADATKEGADESVAEMYNTYKELVDTWAKAND